jgi:hypothetical protein
MSDTDALKGFDFGQFTGGGLFLKFEAGKPITLRVLTVDPMVTTQTFEASDGEINVSTRFSFIVYNFTDGRAQILSASPGVAKKIGDIHADEDFGANIKKVDLKITPTGDKLTRRYEIQVLPKANEMTAEMIKEAQAINLDEKVKDGGRMSLYDPKTQPEPGKTKPVAVPANGGEDDDKDIVLSKLDMANEVDEIKEDEPINLDDIPF